MTIREQLDAVAAERVIILDGAMGSMIQTYRLSEEDFRGERFAEHPGRLQGCNDLLCLTRPGVISAIHQAYLQAGADIIETCSLNATSIFLGDYGLGDLAYEISRASAALAREAADARSSPAKPRFVAGSVGPSSKCAAMSPDLNDPGLRGVYWDELEAAYYDNIRGLLDGGADILLIETIIDTLNAKAALFAASRLMEERGTEIPLMISASVTEGGRLLAGQTLEAFCASVLHARPWSLGLNCSFGAEKLKPHIRKISSLPCLVHAYPNAGLPNARGEYDESPESMAALMNGYLQEGLLNIAGGCCGSTPDHIAALAALAKKYPPRPVPAPARKTVLAGIKVLEPGAAAEPGTPFPGVTIIGDRTSTAANPEFLGLIEEEDWDGAVDIARDMADQGAAMIGVCLDGAPDAEKALRTFLNTALSYPDAASMPVMIESSRWELIEAGLKCVQGKSLVKSISLKDGEAEFLRRAVLIRRYGAAALVTLCDEQAQAADYEKKIGIAERSCRLLKSLGFPTEDIIFDPIAPVLDKTAGQNGSVSGFIRVCARLKAQYSGVQISCCISNLSRNFREDRPFCQALHAVFLNHAAGAGLSLAIADPTALIPREALEPGLREKAEALIGIG